MERISALRDRESNPRLALRVTVESGGCHGYQYKMAIEELQDHQLQGKTAEAADEFDEPDE